MKSIGIVLTAILFFAAGLWMGVSKKNADKALAGRPMPDLTLPHEDAPPYL